MRNDVNLETEQKMEELNRFRDNLLEKIDKYEAELIQNRSEKQENYEKDEKEVIEQASSFIQYFTRYLDEF